MAGIKVGDVVEVVKPIFPENKGVQFRVERLATVHGFRADKPMAYGKVTQIPSEEAHFTVGEEVHWRLDDLKLVEQEPLKEITFDEVKKGDKLRVTWTSRSGDTKYTAEAVAHELGYGGRSQWHTMDRNILVDRSRNDQVILLLERTEPRVSDYGVGTVIQYKHGGYVDLVATKVAENRWSIYTVDSPTWELNDKVLQRDLDMPSTGEHKFLNKVLTQG